MIRPAIKYGLIVGTAHVLFNTILYLSGQGTNGLTGFFSYMILVTGIMFAIREFREENEGLLTIKEGLRVGFVLTALSGFIVAAYTWFYLSYIDDSILELVKEQAKENLTTKGMSPQETKEAVKMTDSLVGPTMMFFSTWIGHIFMGMLLALLTSLMFRSRKEELPGGNNADDF